MKIVTWNVNGLRSVVRRDFQQWLTEFGADIVCLQEVKTEQDLLTTHWFAGYTAYWNPSRRAGHSGVATLVKDTLATSSVALGVDHPELDEEGRVISVVVNGVRFVNVYAPHSHRKLLRLAAKESFLAALTEFLDHSDPSLPSVLLGDFNIAHKDIDLANAKANMKNAGFLPQERAWIDTLLSRNYIDVFRHFDPNPGHYTWWSMREGVKERNIGWRLDYIFADCRLTAKFRSCWHLPDRTGSDHCPVAAELVF